MTDAGHYKLLIQAVLVWLLFFLIGLPDYYQQYPVALIGALSILISVVVSFAAILVCVLSPPELRMRRALWISFYYTAPFFILDALYCGFYLGHGSRYLWTYWYLSIFYVTPWLTFVPTIWLLRKHLKSRPAEAEPTTITPRTPDQADASANGPDDPIVG